MSAPAADARHCKNRREQLYRQPQHLIDQTGIEVDIGADALVHLPLFRNQSRCGFSHVLVEFILLFKSVFHREPFCTGVKNLCAGIGYGINRMSHSVDQARLVECLFVEQGGEVVFDFVPVMDVDMPLHIVEHAHDLDVGAAVLRSFEGAERCCDRGVGVGAGGSHDMGGEGGVVSAAVIGVDHQRKVKHSGFHAGKAAVLAHHMKDVFRRRKMRFRVADQKTLAEMIVPVAAVGIHAQHRKHRDEVEALAQYVGRGNIIRIGVIYIQGKHCPRKDVHDIFAGCFQDEISREGFRQGADIGKVIREFAQLAPVGKF